MPCRRNAMVGVGRWFGRRVRCAIVAPYSARSLLLKYRYEKLSRVRESHHSVCYPAGSRIALPLTRLCGPKPHSTAWGRVRRLQSSIVIEACEQPEAVKSCLRQRYTALCRIICYQLVVRRLNAVLRTGQQCYTTVSRIILSSVSDDLACFVRSSADIAIELL